MRRLIAVLSLVAAAAAVPARAGDVPDGPAAVVVASRSQYYPGDVRNAPALVAGVETLWLHNAEFLSFGDTHSITSDAGLFDTGVIHAGEWARLDLAALPAGTYGFHCSVHEDVMRGALIIV